MHKQLVYLLSGIEVTGNLQKDALQLFSVNGHDEVARHSMKVANEAKRIAKYYGVNEEEAFIAGIFHDTGNIVPLNKRLSFCNEYGIESMKKKELYQPCFIRSVHNYQIKLVL